MSRTEERHTHRTDKKLSRAWSVSPKEVPMMKVSHVSTNQSFWSTIFEIRVKMESEEDYVISSRGAHIRGFSAVWCIVTRMDFGFRQI